MVDCKLYANRRNSARRLSLRAALALLCSVAPIALLARPADCQSNGKGREADSPARNYFTDVELVNQDGKTMRFYSDLLKDRIVIINSFFTTCTSVCPPMTHSIGKIQDWLGDRLGADVHIISISVDPETDTPAKLKEYSQRFKTKPGWFFCGGAKQNVEFVLRKLGQYFGSRDDHTTIILIGNLRTGLWKKAMGMARPEELIKVVDSVLNDKGENSK
ncbi:MAG: SCO family protein [Acidobacteriota bacterium]